LPGDGAVGEPVVAEELPDVFLSVQFRTFGRQWDERDAGRDIESAGEMPAGLVDEERGMGAGAICVAISARWRFIASVSHRGMMSAAPFPSFGQIAPKI